MMLLHTKELIIKSEKKKETSETQTQLADIYILLLADWPKQNKKTQRHFDKWKSNDKKYMEHNK